MAYETQVSYPLCADSSFAITVGSVFAACIYPEEDMPDLAEAIIRIGYSDWSCTEILPDDREAGENHIELIEMILDGK